MRKGFQKGHKIWLGRKHSKSTKAKISASSMGKRGTFGMLGKKHNEVSRKKMGETRRARGIKPTSGFKKGNKPWNFGKKLSKEYREKLSLSHRGQRAWNGNGKTTSEYNKIRAGIEWKLWREAVYVRDDWRCRACGFNKELHPHHILNFATNIGCRFAIDNGITLCRSCHMLFHKIFGTSNNTRPQLEEFLTKGYVDNTNRF